MVSDEELRAELAAAAADPGTASEVADRLCRACVRLLEVDGASLSLTLGGSDRGTLGASGPLSRRLDAWQFTVGEGPCLDSVRDGRPVLVADLQDVAETRWPAFSRAVLQAGVSAVFALPVSVSSQFVGALDLFRHRPGPLSERALSGGLLAAELAALPLLDVLVAGRADVDREAESRSTQLATLDRIEVYQATGMIVGALDVDPSEALVRLRAHAYARDMTAVEVAWEIVERRLSLDTADWHDSSDRQGPAGPGRSTS